MGQFAFTSETLLAGTAWTGTAPGGSSAPSGTINSGSGTYEDLTEYVNTATFLGEIDGVENTNMGSAGFYSEVLGIKRGTLTVTLNDDFASAQLDAKAYSFFGSLVYFDLKPTSSSRGATNPSLVVACYWKTYGVGGGIGSLAQKSLTLTSVGYWAQLTS